MRLLRVRTSNGLFYLASLSCTLHIAAFGLSNNTWQRYFWFLPSLPGSLASEKVKPKTPVYQIFQ